MFFYTLKMIIVYITDNVFFFTGTFVGFELAVDLDYIYKLCISLELFIAILSLLKPLTLNYSFYKMKTSINLSSRELLSFAFVLAIAMTAYATAFYTSLGSYTKEFKDIGSSYMALFRTLLSHVKYREAFLIEIPTVVNQLTFCFFVFSIAIFSVNMFIAILNDAFHRVQRHNSGELLEADVPLFDRELNKHMWKKLCGLFRMHCLDTVCIGRKRFYIKEEITSGNTSLNIDVDNDKFCSQYACPDKYRVIVLLIAYFGFIIYCDKIQKAEFY